MIKRLCDLCGSDAGPKVHIKVGEIFTSTRLHNPPRKVQVRATATFAGSMGEPDLCRGCQIKLLNQIVVQLEDERMKMYVETPKPKNCQTERFSDRLATADSGRSDSSQG